MADSNMDIMKADPIKTLKSASKVSLQGGGTLLFLALAAVWATNTQDWKVSFWLILALLIGSILSGLAGTVARMYDAYLRVQLTLKLMELKGTGNASEAKDKPVIGEVPWDELKDLLEKGHVVHFFSRPGASSVPPSGG
jgi:hypothetical protein